MEWIKCSEQLPPKMTPVLIAAKSWGEWVICAAEWRCLCEKYPVSWSCVGASGYEREDDFEDDGVLFWMPLPDPPAV